MSSEHANKITGIEHFPDHPMHLNLTWNHGPEAEIDFAPISKQAGFQPLADPDFLRNVEIGDWGHSLAWPDGTEIGADSLWLDSLTVWGRDDTRTFLEWRLRNGLSLSGAAEALGLSRRQIAYYSNGDKAVPRTILLACRGWEALTKAA